MESNSFFIALFSAAMSLISLREIPRRTLSSMSVVVCTPMSAAMSASSSSSRSSASMTLRP